MCVCVCVCVCARVCVSRASVTTITWTRTLYVLLGASLSPHLGTPLIPAQNPSYQSKIITLVINTIFFISIETRYHDWYFNRRVALIWVVPILNLGVE
jgi:hypothetical protein